MTVTSKHTPGPWTRETQYISMERKGTTGREIIRGDDGRHIATVDRNNAPIITEAPAMVEALREALPYIAGTESFAATETKIRAILARIDGGA